MAIIILNHRLREPIRCTCAQETGKSLRVGKSGHTPVLEGKRPSDKKNLALFKGGR